MTIERQYLHNGNSFSAAEARDAGPCLACSLHSLALPGYFFVKMFCDRLSAHVSQCVQNEESRPRRHDCAVLEIATQKNCSLDKDTLGSLLVKQLIWF